MLHGQLTPKSFNSPDAACTITCIYPANGSGRKIFFPTSRAIRTRGNTTIPGKPKPNHRNPEISLLADAATRKLDIPGAVRCGALLLPDVELGTRYLLQRHTMTLPPRE